VSACVRQVKITAECTQSMVEFDIVDAVFAVTRGRKKASFFDFLAIAIANQFFVLRFVVLDSQAWQQQHLF